MASFSRWLLLCSFGQPSALLSSGEPGGDRLPRGIAAETRTPATRTDDAPAELIAQRHGTSSVGQPRPGLKGLACLILILGSCGLVRGSMILLGRWILFDLVSHRCCGLTKGWFEFGFNTLDHCTAQRSAVRMRVGFVPRWRSQAFPMNEASGSGSGEPEGHLGIPLFLLGFSVWRLASADYWGAILGLIFAFCVAVRPTPRASTIRRKRAFLGGVIALLIVSLLAVWRTVSH